MANKPYSCVLVVGMQKSGTTILTRLLEATKQFVPVGAGEADTFWGNVPSFTPSAYPCGQIYSSHQGKHGHQADANDADARMIQTMQARLRAAQQRQPQSVPLNKNPYNVVRLPWLRRIFPKAYIVLIERDAVANAFSLKKRYVTLRTNKTGAAAEWWGVKPANWQGMARPTAHITEQIALQLGYVHQRIAATKHIADCVVQYQELCHDPTRVLRNIVQACVGHDAAARITPKPALTCFNAEYRKGAKMISQNKLSRQGFARTLGSSTLAPFTPAEVALIETHTRTQPPDTKPSD